jgi:hypothetical protein
MKLPPLRQTIILPLLAGACSLMIYSGKLVVPPFLDEVAFTFLIFVLIPMFLSNLFKIGSIDSSSVVSITLSTFFFYLLIGLVVDYLNVFITRNLKIRPVYLIVIQLIIILYLANIFGNNVFAMNIP